jgi:hypothetical protein
MNEWAQLASHKTLVMDPEILISNNFHPSTSVLFSLFLQLCTNVTSILNSQEMQKQMVGVI